jgi:hypothetical protein
MAALTDSGDHKIFSSSVTKFSLKSGYTPIVRPNGLITGGAATPTVTNNQVAISALTSYLIGVLTSVAGGNLTVTRGTTNGYMINSLTITSAGALANVAGTESTAFSEVRGAAGGPPFIAVGSVEIGQVRFTSITAGVVLASEIFAVIGFHQERWDYPAWVVNEEAGTITLLAALPLSHTGSLPKRVYGAFYEPIFVKLENVADVVLPEISHSLASKEVYGGAIGAASQSIGQAGFTAYLENGISDPFLYQKNQNIWFKWYPDINAGNYAAFCGLVGLGRVFPAGDVISAKVTVSSAKAATEVIA